MSAASTYADGLRAARNFTMSAEWMRLFLGQRRTVFLLPRASNDENPRLVLLTYEFEALEGSRVTGSLLAANYFADATEANIRARSRRLRQCNHVLDRFPNRHRRLGRKKNSTGTDIPGFALGLGLGCAIDNLEGKAQIKPLVFPLFHHCANECIGDGV